jgi:hypothetical protein
LSEQINIVLASSQQRGLGCAMGDSEQAHMFQITTKVHNLLKPDNRLNIFQIPLKSGTDTQNLIDTVNMSNDFILSNGGDGYHLGLHSDGGAYSTGASGLFVSRGGEAWITPIFEEISAITPWNDIGLRSRTGLWELNQTIAIAGIIEVSFHDIPEEAEWIHGNMDLIADAIVKGIYRAIGLDRPQGDSMTPDEEAEVIKRLDEFEASINKRFDTIEKTLERMI